MFIEIFDISRIRPRSGSYWRRCFYRYKHFTPSECALKRVTKYKNSYFIVCLTLSFLVIKIKGSLTFFCGLGKNPSGF